MKKIQNKNKKNTPSKYPNALNQKPKKIIVKKELIPIIIELYTRSNSNRNSKE
ncbi:MAG: hypothetical protein ACI4JW_10460 [Oscillospiraceae bacterium]